jgi:hypothetical protein
MKMGFGIILISSFLTLSGATRKEALKESPPGTLPASTQPRIGYVMGSPIAPEAIEQSMPGLHGRLTDRRDNFFLTAMLVGGGGRRPGERVLALVESMPQGSLKSKLQDNFLNWGDVVGILAPSVGEAQTQLTELLDALNAWWKENREPLLSSRLERLRDDLAKAQQVLADKQKQKDQLSARLAGLDGLREDFLRQMQSRLLSLEVDVAGVGAELGVAEQLRQKLPGDSGEQRKVVESVIAKAQIELARLSAEQGQIRQIIKAGEEMARFGETYREASAKVSLCEDSVKWLEEELGSPYQPFTLHPEVTIQPIDWSHAGQEPQP